MWQRILTMPLFICTACGTQHPESAQVPAHCVVCERSANTSRHAGIIGIGSTPAFAIGQRALFVRTDQGNILWDCIATLDDATVTMIEGLGGIDAIAISHPHFYTTMVEWARAFRSPIHLHAADKQWIMRTDPAIELWTARQKHFGMASRLCAVAVILKVARCCIGAAGQADAVLFAPATYLP